MPCGQPLGKVVGIPDGMGGRPLGKGGIWGRPVGKPEGIAEGKPVGHGAAPGTAEPGPGATGP
jgi:hypothetical protein